MAHPSNSSEQLEAESEILATLRLELGRDLRPRTFELSTGARLLVDGATADGSLLCEIYSHIGKLKGSQPDKIASDILKLLAIERSLDCPCTKIICFADLEAAQCLRNRSWLAAVATTLGIEVRVVALSSELRSRVIAAQQRQTMSNAKL